MSSTVLKQIMAKVTIKDVSERGRSIQGTRQMCRNSTQQTAEEKQNLGSKQNRRVGPARRVTQLYAVISRVRVRSPSIRAGWKGQHSADTAAVLAVLPRILHSPMERRPFIESGFAFFGLGEQAKTPVRPRDCQ